MDARHQEVRQAGERPHLHSAWSDNHRRCRYACHASRSGLRTTRGPLVGLARRLPQGCRRLICCRPRRTCHRHKPSPAPRPPDPRAPHIQQYTHIRPTRRPPGLAHGVHRRRIRRRLRLRPPHNGIQPTRLRSRLHSGYLRILLERPGRRSREPSRRLPQPVLDRRASRPSLIAGAYPRGSGHRSLNRRRRNRQGRRATNGSPPLP